MKLPLYILAEWLAFVSSFLLWYPGIEKRYRLLFLYMFVVVIVEFVGGWMKERLIPNQHMFNIACLYYYTYYLYLVRSEIQSPKRKKIILVFAGILILFYFVNLLFLQGWDVFNSNSFLLGAILVVFSCTLYYLENMEKNEQVQVLSNPSFYIVNALMIHTGMIAFLYSAHKYFAYLNINVKLYRDMSDMINNIANVTMYLLLTVAFIIIWMKRKS